MSLVAKGHPIIIFRGRPLAIVLDGLEIFKNGFPIFCFIPSCAVGRVTDVALLFLHSVCRLLRVLHARGWDSGTSKFIGDLISCFEVLIQDSHDGSHTQRRPLLI